MVEWQHLRSWNGSQFSAFEELCCQLASYFPVPSGSRFARLGAPDAGVECYWTLPNGEEWGWQSKFFLTAPQETQWQQMSSSVKTALAKRPKLTRYTICLPIDRQDPKIESAEWFMDQWVKYVEKWKQIRTAAEPQVEFEYWGNFELAERLSQEVHRGRSLFWFDRNLFSDNWFKQHVEDAVSNVGPRYTPELNINLPIAKIFEGLGQTTAYISEFKDSASKLDYIGRTACGRSTVVIAPVEAGELKTSLGEIAVMNDDWRVLNRAKKRRHRASRDEVQSKYDC